MQPQHAQQTQQQGGNGSAPSRERHTSHSGAAGHLGPPHGATSTRTFTNYPVLLSNLDEHHSVVSTKQLDNQGSIPSTLTTIAQIHHNLGTATAHNIAQPVSLNQPLMQLRINAHDSVSHIDPDPRNLGNLDRGFVQPIVDLDPYDAQNDNLINFRSHSHVLIKTLT